MNTVFKETPNNGLDPTARPPRVSADVGCRENPKK